MLFLDIHEEQPRRHVASHLGGFALEVIRSRRTISEPWLSTSAVARRCRVTSQTVRAWVKAGELHPTRTPGGHYRYNPAEVDALLVGVGATPSDTGALA